MSLLCYPLTHQTLFRSLMWLPLPPLYKCTWWLYSTLCTFCYLTSCISPGLHPCPAMMRWLWRRCGYITFLQLTDPLHQGIQRALGLQPVSGRGVGQHALLLLEVVHFLQELFFQLSKTTLQQVTELTGEGGAWYVGPHLLLLMKGGQRDYEAFLNSSISDYVTLFWYVIALFGRLPYWEEIWEEVCFVDPYLRHSYL